MLLIIVPDIGRRVFQERTIFREIWFLANQADERGALGSHAFSLQREFFLSEQ